MKQERDKDRELDDLFKSGLGDPMQEPAFREEDWDAMEAMLDERKKRSAIVRWLPVMATVAAVALLFLAWAFLRPQASKTDKVDNNTQAVVGKKSNQSAGSQLAGKDSLKEKDQQLANVPQKAVSQPQPNNVAPATGNQKPSALTAATSTGKRKIVAEEGKKASSGPGNVITGASAQNGQQIAALSTTQKGNPKIDASPSVTVDQPKTNVADNVAVSSSAIIKGNTVATVDAPKTVQIGSDTTKPAGTKSDQTISKPIKAKPIGKSLGYKPQLAITALASSDFNGVGSSFAQTRVGGNFGALFSVGITRKFTISTGAIYAIKPYAETSSQYHTAYQFKQPLQQIVADCRMLDIPINVDYQLYHAHNNKFSVGTGLSSYLMMSEKYNYTYTGYTDAGPGTPASYNVAHPGKYYLGVLNLQATYQHQVNSRFGVAVQPYMKVPLGNVGFSQVKLQSTGLAVGVSYNISSGGR